MNNFRFLSKTEIGNYFWWMLLFSLLFFSSIIFLKPPFPGRMRDKKLFSHTFDVKYVRVCLTESIGFLEKRTNISFQCKTYFAVNRMEKKIQTLIKPKLENNLSKRNQWSIRDCKTLAKIYSVWENWIKISKNLHQA